VMLVMFLLGFVLDFIEITFVVVPIVGPILLALGLDPVWLGVMIAINLQTSFLTPPFGFALFYLRGVAPDSVATLEIYRGVMPYVAIQLLALVILAIWPQLATWLPRMVYG
jgi:TRAP-type mannitol/chloroaromatic compound transport system permease large subunit